MLGFDVVGQFVLGQISDISGVVPPAPAVTPDLGIEPWWWREQQKRHRRRKETLQREDLARRLKLRADLIEAAYGLPPEPEEPSQLELGEKEPEAPRFSHEITPDIIEAFANLAGIGLHVDNRAARMRTAAQALLARIRERERREREAFLDDEAAIEMLLLS